MFSVVTDNSTKCLTQRRAFAFLRGMSAAGSQAEESCLSWCLLLF